MMTLNAKAYRWVDSSIRDLGRQLRWSYLPALMVYLAAGVSGLTGIVGTFFVKEHFGLSATFLAGALHRTSRYGSRVPLGADFHDPNAAWIAKNAPTHLKATFFAVMGSFTNFALTASSLGTKYVNQLFIVEREVRDPIQAARSWLQPTMTNWGGC